LLAGTIPQTVTDIVAPTRFDPRLPFAGGRHRGDAAGAAAAYSTLAPAMIVFLILTGVPILLTPAVQSLRGEAAAWGVVGPIGTLIAVLLAVLVWLMSSVQRRAP
jgi:hypothetical protein